VALSSQANYTDWATATCRRNLVPNFAEDGVSRGHRGGSPTVVNLNCCRLETLLSFQVAPHLYSRGWVDPVPDPLLLRKFGSAQNLTQDLWVNIQKLWPLDHRGGQGPIIVIIIIIIIIITKTVDQGFGNLATSSNRPFHSCEIMRWHGA
jgi:hypothetical protein